MTRMVQGQVQQHQHPQGQSQCCRPRRVVVKVGSSSITDVAGKLSEDKMKRLAMQCGFLQQAGLWQVLLVSSGALAAGLGQLGWARASLSLAERQSAAAVGQSLLMHAYEPLFQRLSIQIAQLLLVRQDLEQMARYQHVRNTIEMLLGHQILPIVNENDTVAATPGFGGNDCLAALIAIMVGADRLVLLTDQNGLYDGDPHVNPHASHIADVWQITDEIERMAGASGSLFGTGGMRTKVAAARLAMAAGIDVVVAASAEPDVLLRILSGDAVGTVFHATTGEASEGEMVYATRG